MIHTSLARRPAAALAVCLGALAIGCGPLTAAANAAPGPAYLPGRVVVGYAAPMASVVQVEVSRRMGIRMVASAAASTDASGAATSTVVTLPRGLSVAAAVARLRHQPGVAYVVPDYLAHASGSFVPDDVGRTHRAGGWEQLQWNFLPGTGADAPRAWANLIADHRAGGRGVVVAVLDTGVAFRKWRQFKASPDFAGTRFVDPCDLVAGTIRRNRCTNVFPLDREGHGTFVTGTIAEATNNRLGVTGLAYGASIMPVRILDADGTGDAGTIGRGIRYAVGHGAQVINLSLEFSLDVSATDIPEIISALHYARAHGVAVVAAAGNDSGQQIAYPARTSTVISVGATTLDRCLADYSNVGAGLDLVAPGGGDDTSLLSDPDCHPNRELPDVYQMTFNDSAYPNRFGLPSGWYGTSMSAPVVSASAALVIASRVIGAHPSPEQILARLEHTAQPLGGAQPNENYGYGLVDAGAATAPAAIGTPAGQRG
ncbi:MAG: S8 family serine peptidase [Solirubrobacteraceae bacterium]